MSRAEKAKEYFMQGYTCSQAVAMSFVDVMGLGEDTVMKSMLPFGGGLGRLRLTCGAVSGMAFVIGALYGSANNDAENKKEVYAIVQMLGKRFQEKYGTLLCSELIAGMHLPLQVGGAAEERSKEYYKKRSCGDIVYDAAAILEEYLMERNMI